MTNRRMDLLTKNCVPCRKDTPVLGEDEISRYLTEIPGLIRVCRGIDQTFDFDNPDQASDFITKVKFLADQEDHHPIISYFRPLRVKIFLFTEVVNGLTLNDFIMASKIEAIAFAITTDTYIQQT